MNPPKMKIMKGNPGVTHVSGVVQYSAVSEWCNAIFSLFFVPSCRSNEKLYFGFLDLNPKNIAKIFFDFVSSKSWKIS